MNTEQRIPHTDDAVETITLRHVPQESVSLYEAVNTDGEVVALLLAEAIENPERFEQRTEAERSAMQVLALDDYYKGTDWEGTILDDQVDNRRPAPYLDKEID